MKKFFKTTITIEILSEKKYNSTDLEKIAYDITDGDCSGVVNVTGYDELTPEQAAKALLAQGSDPEFFGLSVDGKSIDLDDDLVTLERGSVLQPAYYQPVLTEEEMIQSDFYSFQVYRSKENAERDFPGKEIKEYFGDDIEDPTFVDDENSFE